MNASLRTPDLRRWLQWVREIQALSQTGLAYSETDYNAQCYRRLAEITAEMVQSHTALAKEARNQKFPNAARIRHGKN